MTITAITGHIGAGKSWYQLKHGLELAEQRKKRLVTNFGLNFKALEKYASDNGLPWVQWLAQEGQIAVIDTAERLQDLLVYPRSVVLLDEAGVFLNARDFSATPKKLLTDLAQSRKDGQDLIYAAQFDEQVDKQFRNLTQFFVHAAGLSKYCPKLRGPRLHWKQYHHFLADGYALWRSSPKDRSGFFSTVRHAIKSECGPFTKHDSRLFDCFDSFTRLERQAAAARGFSPACEYPLSSVISDSIRAARVRDYYAQIRSNHNALLMATPRDVIRAFRAK